MPDLAALRAAVATYFGLRPDQVCVYGNICDIDPPFEDETPGAQWLEFEASDVRVRFDDSDKGRGPVCAWFTVETRERADNDFEDRPLARGIAAALNQTIVFRDPAPDPLDHPIAEAAQIAVEPDGSEAKVWFVEYGENGMSKNLLERRDDP
jgi:hypothetical protein